MAAIIEPSAVPLASRGHFWKRQHVKLSSRSYGAELSIAVFSSTFVDGNRGILALTGGSSTVSAQKSG